MAQNKKFRLFDMNRDGPGVSKHEKPFVPNFVSVPKFYFRNFTRMLTLNLFMLPLLLLPLAAIYTYIVAPTTPSQMSVMYAPLYGAQMLTGNPAWVTLLGVYGLQLNLPVFDAVHIGIYVVLAILLALMWGPVNIGATYICRSIFRAEPVFMWSDFWYAVRKNIKQGMIFGVLDAVCIGALVFDLLYYIRIGGTFVLDFLFFAICGVIIIYSLMRFYIYLMIVTFDMKLRKILKNALIFSILGIGRSLTAVFWMLMLIGANVLLVIAFYPIRFFAPLFLPFIYLLPSICLLKTYAAYPTIKKYMIDPIDPSADSYTDDDSDGDNDEDDDNDDDGDGGDPLPLPQ